MKLFQTLFISSIVSLLVCCAASLEFTVGEFINISKELDLGSQWCNKSSRLPDNDTEAKCWLSCKPDFENSLSHVLGVKVTMPDYPFSYLYHALECKYADGFSLKTTSYISQSTVLFTFNLPSLNSAPTSPLEQSWLLKNLLQMVKWVLKNVIAPVIRVTVYVWVCNRLRKYRYPSLPAINTQHAREELEEIIV